MLELGFSLDKPRDSKEASETQATEEWYMTDQRGQEPARATERSGGPQRPFVFIAVIFQV